MAAISRYLVHACVLLVAVAGAMYASLSRQLPAGLNLHPGAVNAEALTIGEGDLTAAVDLGRAGTIIKPDAIPSQAQVQHTPISYTVLPGDDVYSIAVKFHVTANEIRWSNPDRLTHTDRLSPGEVIMVPPVQGVVVDTKPGDTVASLAATYRIPVETVIEFNYMRDPQRMGAGETLVLPDARGPQLWPRRASDLPAHLGGFSDGAFPVGQCTYYVASRRFVPWNGNAWQWFGNARAMGYATGRLPEPGAIMVTWESLRYGHVAYVEQVNEDGSFVVSEMNYRAWDSIDTRTIAGPGSVPLIGFVY